MRAYKTEWKRWNVSLNAAQRDWIEQITDGQTFNGSAVIQYLIEEARERDRKELRLAVERRIIQEQVTTKEQELEKLTARLSGKVTAGKKQSGLPVVQR